MLLSQKISMIRSVKANLKIFCNIINNSYLLLVLSISKSLGHT